MEKPKSVLIRRRTACEWIGVPPQEFDKAVRAGLIPYKVLYKNGKKWFKTEDIERVFLNGFRGG
jgi:hypothetical protein